MPKTNKICMYFDKEELQQIMYKLDWYLNTEHKDRVNSNCDEKHHDIEIQLCDCQSCIELSNTQEIIYRTIQKIKSRLS